MSDLGRLERVDLRYVWPTEAHDFTPWLAREDNLVLLGETLGVDLELEKSEKRVGPFSADILCRTSDDNRYVVIENQLEKSDHKHLGQILTYSAALNAGIIVWIAAEFEKEHAATIEWLNDTTNESLEFFAVQLSLFSVDGSNPAPDFRLVAVPNVWRKRKYLNPLPKKEKPVLQKDGVRCLHHILEMTVGSAKEQVFCTVVDLINDYVSTSSFIRRRELNSAAASLGLRLVGDHSNPSLLVANDHPSLRANFHGTDWSEQNWKQSLIALTGARKVGTRTFRGKGSRAVEIPFSYLSDMGENQNGIEVSG